MIEYVVEESVRPDGAIRWLVTSMFSGSASELWSTLTEEEALVLAANRCSFAGTISVATRDGWNSDYGRNDALQRIQDLRKMGAAAAGAITAADISDPSSLVGKTVSVNVGGPRLVPKATVMGVSFIMGTLPHGEFWWADADQAWIVSQHTYDAMRAGPPNSVQRQVSELRKARTEGRQVVKAQVTNNPRRPAAPRPRKGDLHDLRDRTQALVVQIATMSDAGPIPDGQVVELSKSYAALQAEFDDAMGEVEQVKENLSIMRAIMFEHSDPRNAQEAIA